MSYSVKIAEPHIEREVTFTAPTSEEAVRMARSWSPMTGQVQSLATYQRDPPDQTSTPYKPPAQRAAPVGFEAFGPMGERQ